MGPKCWGGLGIKPVKTWNIAAITKNIWGIISLKPSLWANWVSVNKLKRMSFWGITKPHEASWSWRQLLNIRNRIAGERFPEVVVKDSEVDKCAMMSILFQFGIMNNFKVQTNSADEVTCMSTNGSFSIKACWKFINPTEPVIPWTSIVWFKGNIPRFSFITWLALMNRLLTRDKLFKWKVIQDEKCCFCNTASESINHLFFECSYSRGIWNRLLADMNINRDGVSWRREVSFFVRRTKGKSRLAIFRKSIFCAAIYHIWRARNDLIFNKNQVSEYHIYKSIRLAVHYAT
ncbi:uncharacterized protein LOC126668315 [Mercurialis annua]|uniref:uncharacterized protein LOC126668315 n=1 Tax=Mercurialis annua TaxID=3986 RepID=UPI00215F9526|nr:uncharacterized protein LOC126668315 [Mercurialis annua]